MVAFIKAHYGKAVAFFTGWLAEAQVELTGYLKAVLAALGIGD
jgi:hypothetical protein